MIFYFSGTGNSLRIAEVLSRQFRCPMIHMDSSAETTVSQQALLKQPETNPVAPAIGFVFPVYCYDVPEFLEQFFQSFPVSDTTYYYALATCGGDPGNTLHTVDQFLQNKGGKLSYGRVLTMPDNMAPLFEEKYNMQSLFTVDSLLKSIGQDITARREYRQEIVFVPETIEKTQKARTALAETLSPKLCDAGRCIVCGSCESVCPEKNITIHKREVLFGQRCVDCLACVHWCPEAAISAGKLVVEQHSKYHHPEVQVTDMARHR